MRRRYRPLALLLCALAAGCEMGTQEAALPAPAVAPQATTRAAPAVPDTAAPTTDGLVEPEPAPDFTLPAGDGAFALADQRGHVVVLNFWATWNELSVAGMGALADLHDTLADDGVVVVGLAEDDDAEAALQAWTAAHDAPPYPLLADADGAVARRYGGIEMLPTTVVVDRAGRLRARHIGILTEDELLDLLGPVLIEEDAPATPLPVAHPGVVLPLAADDVDALIRAGAVLVDVREDPARRAAGAFPYALHRPLGLLASDDLPANFATPLIFADEGGDASAEAADRAVGWGYQAVFRLDGGVPAWEAAGLPLEPVPAPPAPAAPQRPAPIVPARSVLG